MKNKFIYQIIVKNHNNINLDLYKHVYLYNYLYNLLYDVHLLHIHLITILYFYIN
jgi:hypothetical protein